MEAVFESRPISTKPSRLQDGNGVLAAKQASSELRYSDYASLLRQCGNSKALSEGKHVHAQLVRTGQDGDTLLGNLLVQMYGKCGSLSNARAAFERIHQRNVYTWTLMISAYTQNGHPREALRLYQRMDSEGAEPDMFVFSSILGVCTKLGALAEARAIHARIAANGFESDVVVQNALVNLYAKWGCLDEARTVFDKMPVRDVISWNAIFAAYAQHGGFRCYREGLELFQHMDVEPDVVTFVSILGMCSSLGSLAEGKAIHARIVSTELESDVILQNALVNMYAKCGSPKDARIMFDRMRRKDVISWNAMIAAYAQNGYGVEALELHRQMDLEGWKSDAFTFSSILGACSIIGALAYGKALFERIGASEFSGDAVIETALFNMYAKSGSLEEARTVFDKMSWRDSVSWSAMIAAYAQSGHAKTALKLYSRMCLEGVQPDMYTFSSVLGACSELQALEEGRAIHAQVVASGLESGIVVGTALIDLYAKCGCLDVARSVFDRMQQRNTITWNAMLAGYLQHGQDRAALDLHANMDVDPDSFTFATVLSSCANLVAVAEARSIHAKLVANKLDRDVVVGTALIDMYAKCGSLNDARSVFCKLRSRDAICWNAMLAAYAHFGGHSGDAIEHLQQAYLEGVEPNELTFNSILHACSHAGLLEAGYQYFISMRGDHGVLPNADNYHCMTDLLARSGQLSDAEDLISNMPFQTQALAWMTLLAACRLHNDTERGERAGEHILQLGCDVSSAPYVLLSTIYAGRNRKE